MFVVGQRYDGFTILDVFEKQKGKYTRKYIKCLCFCGNIKDVREDIFRSIKSCGCIRGKRKPKEVSTDEWKQKLAKWWVPEPNTGCWLWLGALDKGGYARRFVRGFGSIVSRIFYKLYIGPIPENLVIDHLCRQRSCINPQHLEPVTSKENIRRGETGKCAAERVKERAKNRLGCKNGHKYLPNNFYIVQGYRECKICRINSVKKYQAKKYGN